MSEPDPNLIEIYIRDGSKVAKQSQRGWMHSGKFEGNVMDPRLMYYMTAQEYQGTLVKLNAELGKQQKSVNIVCVVLIVITVIFGILSPIIASQHSPELTACSAPKGYCSNTTFDPFAGQCCLVYCCQTDVGEFPEPGQYSSATSCSRSGSRRDGDIERWGSKQTCSCTKGKHKQMTCSGEVKYEGQLKVIAEKNGWALVVFPIIVSIALCSFICNFVQCDTRARLLPRKLAPHWAIWQSKGIAVSVSAVKTAGSKYSQIRLVLVMPAGGPHMQGGCVGAMPPPVCGGGDTVQPFLEAKAVQPQTVTVGQTWPARSAESNNPAPLQATVVS